MARSSSNLAIKETRQSAYEGAETPLGSHGGGNATARAQNVRKCLSVVPAKRIADSLGVALRTVQKWAAGEARVPEERLVEIQRESVAYFLDLEIIHRETERDLILNHGPRNGHSSRGGYV